MKSNYHQNGTLLVRAGAWMALSWERLWPLLVPLVLVAITFFSLSWLGIWENIPTWLHVVVLSAVAIAFVAALIPLRQFKSPAENEVSRRIEVETRLDDRPISAQVDDIALGQGDEFSKALWNEHRARMAERLENLTGGPPRARGDRFDRYGLRLMLPILAFIALVISFGADGGRVSDAFRLGGDPAKLLTRLDVWVNPPTYTRKAPVYLAVKSDHQQGQVLQIPQFSELVGRFAGKGDITLRFDDGENESEIVAQELPGESSTTQKERFFKLELTQSGEVSVYSRNSKIAQWTLNIVEDAPPQIKFEEEPGAALSGSLQLSYSVKDDYGVVRARGIVEPGRSGDNGFDPELPAKFIPPPNARSLIEPLEIKLPLPRRQAKDGKTKTNRDITKHPLAGSLVKLMLVAEDEAEQKGYSETKELILPGRNFVNPLAKALIEQRRILALDANQQQFVVSMLDALMVDPEKFIDNFTAVLAMKVTYRKLVDARSDDQLRDVLDLLWDVALGIEFGNISDVERRLREAQERLSEALENGAGDEEIDRLMKELRQAMNEMMQALSEQARRNPQSQNPMMQDDTARTLRQRDLERMMDRIENLAKSGSKDAARELLSEMQRMMDNLRAGRHMQQRQAEGNQMNQTLNQLSELMREQQRLLDETFQMEQRRQQNQQGQSNPGNQEQQNGQQNRDQQSQNGENQQQNGEMTAQELADALRQLQEQQQALQEQLSGLNQRLEELGLEPSGEFGEAGEEMGEAGRQLGQGETGDAAGSQGRALEALRQGAQSMMRQMAGDRQQGGRQQGRGNSGRNSNMARDPLGRNQQDQGMGLDSGNTDIPGEIDAQRARDILDAIRKRLSKPEQRLIEKKYLERLLDDQ
ncbi:MAG: TIGR02302 family protein [Rhizobiaceae bacterium]|nr:TIGR02302 family protein [Rhizobiaceae bacterium]